MGNEGHRISEFLAFVVGISLIGLLFAGFAIMRRGIAEEDPRVSPDRQTLTDVSMAALALGSLLFPGETLYWRRAVPIGSFGLLLFVFSLIVALFGRGRGRVTVLLGHASMLTWTYFSWTSLSH